jgi:hypothetical protein
VGGPHGSYSLLQIKSLKERARKGEDEPDGSSMQEILNSTMISSDEEGAGRSSLGEAATPPLLFM